MGQTVRMKSGVRAALAGGVAAALLVVAGCMGGGKPGDGGPAPSSGTPTVSATRTVTATRPSTPTVPADVPTTGPNLRKPGERPPVMPLAATAHTSAGAVAFARFFVQTMDWGYATTNSAYMRHYFQPSCVPCKQIQIDLDTAQRRGHHYLGGRVTILRSAAGVTGGPHGAELSVVVRMNITSVEDVDKDGNFVDADVAYNDYRQEVWLSWKQDAWTVVDTKGTPS